MSATELDDEGMSLFKDKRYAEAEQVFRRLLELEPRSASAWIGLCFTLALLTRNSESQAAMAKAFEINRSAALVTSADYMIIGRRFDDARYALMTAMKEDKKASASGDVWYRLGYCHAMQDRIAEAEIDLRMATGLSPNEGRYWHVLGWVLSTVKKDKDAKIAFGQAEKMGFVADQKTPSW